MQDSSRPTARRWTSALVVALVLVGSALRISWYLFDRSLTYDEAAVAVHVLNTPAIALWIPPGNHVAVPAGFMLAMKLAIRIFGAGERALRLPSLLAGLAALPLFYALARKYASRETALLALLFFSLNPWMVYWSTECKPYMADVVFTIAALLVAASIADRGLTSARATGAALFGAVALVCSFAMLFVLSGVGAVLAVAYLKRKDPRQVRLLAAVGIVWVCGAAAAYVFSLRALRADALLNTEWSERFFSLRDIQRDYRLLSSAFLIPAGFVLRHPWPVIPFFVIGSVVIAMDAPVRWALLAAPALCVAFAALFHVYPFWHRAILFLAPMLVLQVAEGIASVVRWTARYRRPVAVALAVVLVAACLRASMVTLRRGPQPLFEVRPQLAYLERHTAPGDVVYVAELAPLYEYYARQGGIDVGPYVVGRYIEAAWSAADDRTLDSLKGQRVWVLSADPGTATRLDARGRREEAFGEADDVMLYLYDLRTGP